MYKWKVFLLALLMMPSLAIYSMEESANPRVPVDKPDRPIADVPSKPPVDELDKPVADSLSKPPLDKPDQPLPDNPVVSEDQPNGQSMASGESTMKEASKEGRRREGRRRKRHRTRETAKETASTASMSSEQDSTISEGAPSMSGREKPTVSEGDQSVPVVSGNHPNRKRSFKEGRVSYRGLRHLRKEIRRELKKENPDFAKVRNMKDKLKSARSEGYESYSRHREVRRHRGGRPVVINEKVTKIEKSNGVVKTIRETEKVRKRRRGRGPVFKNEKVTTIEKPNGVVKTTRETEKIRKGRKGRGPIVKNERVTKIEKPNGVVKTIRETEKIRKGRRFRGPVIKKERVTTIEKPNGSVRTVVETGRSRPRRGMEHRRRRPSVSQDRMSRTENFDAMRDNQDRRPRRERRRFRDI